MVTRLFVMAMFKFMFMFTFMFMYMAVRMVNVELRNVIETERGNLWCGVKK
jgi:hypothetical protein